MSCALKNPIDDDLFLLRSLLSFHLKLPDALYSFPCCYMDSWREDWFQVQTTSSSLIHSLASRALQTLSVSSLAPSKHILVPRLPPRQTSQLLFHVFLFQSLINDFTKFLLNLNFNREIYIFSVTPYLEPLDCNLQEHKWSEKTE